ncbi:nucleoid-associated protein Lsr2 (plasmid) [Prauserella marina]|uniref:Lsr2 protein n=1 Tax=Prauserella marina TaxID=530584 RepID=A0A222W160_9PSEU|nr:Lsr2 family protein [Prauserella marina]ASR39919.1 nucleoid-associated protein Lsr2 [Prauserella marina]PWV71419.1 Lsr2 protein [Prauserella marina]SDD98084.1 Lsr2 protein [Prauserella marina]
MAQQVFIELVDDLDGSEAEETVTFGLDGVHYEIDLCEDNADELRDALARYIEHARRTGGRRRTTARRRGASSNGSVGASSAPPQREETTAIREWARTAGFEVADRGRLPADVITAYRARRAT